MIIIYAIRNKQNGKAYIGQSKNPVSRKHSHFSKLRKNTHRNENFQKDFDIYGEENFYLEILSQLEDESKADYREKLWISKLKNVNGVYNITSGGKKQFLHGESSKQKMVDWHKNNPARRVLKGKHHPMYGTKGGMFGKKHTEEAKEKIRQASLKYRHSEEVLKKMSEVRKGVPNVNHPSYIPVTQEMKDDLINGMSYKDFCEKHNCKRDKVKRIKNELKEKNMLSPKNPQSGATGIVWDKERLTWKVFLYNGNERTLLGRYKDISEAKKVLEIAKLKII